MAQRMGAAAVAEFHPSFPRLEAPTGFAEVLNRPFRVG